MEELSAQGVTFPVQADYYICLLYTSGWTLTKINPYSKMNAVFGCQNDKMKNWETNANGYTSEEMKALEEAYNAEK